MAQKTYGGTTVETRRTKTPFSENFHEPLPVSEDVFIAVAVDETDGEDGTGNELRVEMHFANPPEEVGNVEECVSENGDDLLIQLSAEDQAWVLDTARTLELPEEVVLETWFTCDRDKDVAFDTLVGFRYNASDGGDTDRGDDRAWG